jgi:hypothetical protein
MVEVPCKWSRSKRTSRAGWNSLLLRLCNWTCCQTELRNSARATRSEPQRIDRRKAIWIPNLQVFGQMVRWSTDARCVPKPSNRSFVVAPVEEEGMMFTRHPKRLPRPISHGCSLKSNIAEEVAQPPMEFFNTHITMFSCCFRRRKIGAWHVLSYYYLSGLYTIIYSFLPIFRSGRGRLTRRERDLECLFSNKREGRNGRFPFFPPFHCSATWLPVHENICFPRQTTVLPVGGTINEWRPMPPFRRKITMLDETFCKFIEARCTKQTSLKSRYIRPWWSITSRKKGLSSIARELDLHRDPRVWSRDSNKPIWKGVNHWDTIRDLTRCGRI